MEVKRAERCWMMDERADRYEDTSPRQDIGTVRGCKAAGCSSTGKEAK